MSTPDTQDKNTPDSIRCQRHNGKFELLTKNEYDGLKPTGMLWDFWPGAPECWPSAPTPPAVVPPPGTVARWKRAFETENANPDVTLTHTKPTPAPVPVPDAQFAGEPAASAIKGGNEVATGPISPVPVPDGGTPLTDVSRFLKAAREQLGDEKLLATVALHDLQACQEANAALREQLAVALRERDEAVNRAVTQRHALDVRDEQLNAKDATIAALRGELENFKTMNKETHDTIKEITNAFLMWKLPESVRADDCATKQGPGRIGTNLLSYSEAFKMFEEIVMPRLAAAHARADALAKDGERMDWLENGDKCYWATIQSQPNGDYIWNGQHGGLRAAIDAARRAGAGEEGK